MESWVSLGFSIILCVNILSFPKNMCLPLGMGIKGLKSLPTTGHGKSIILECGCYQPNLDQESPVFSIIIVVCTL